MVGDVVWAPFPFTDMTQVKLRPVVVVADVQDRREHDWLVCEITSQTGHIREIPIARADMQFGQLQSRNSRVRPDRIATVDESQFVRTIGRLTDAKLADVLAVVRALF